MTNVLKWELPYLLKFEARRNNKGSRLTYLKALSLFEYLSYSSNNGTQRWVGIAPVRVARISLSRRNKIRRLEDLASEARAGNFAIDRYFI